MAAERLAQAGFKVTIYDHMPSPGRKFLMAGRGGLNLTHSEPFERFSARFGERQALMQPMLEAFPPEAVRAWADGLGQETFVGTSGRVFPKPLKASPLLRAWLVRLNNLGVSLRTRHRWMGWDEQGALRFDVEDVRQPTYSIATTSAVTILALGGASWPRLGSDARWVTAMREAGVAVAPFEPSNVGVKIAWSDLFRSRFEGQPIKRLVASVGNDAQTGEAMVTREGLEGGAIYGLGPAVRAALAANGTAALRVDVRPSFTHEELAAKIAGPRNKQSTSNFLRKAAGMAPIAIALVREGGGGPLPLDPHQLAALIKAVPLTVTGLSGLSRAISSAGGVQFDGLDHHLMMRQRPGVFVAGEMLDWDAPTGGYLLQATFATAVTAADGAAAWLASRV
jgi:uncharacterized flavoprotein (TIGR03862 family)